MPGERWLQVRALLEAIDLQNLQQVAQDWDRFGLTMYDVVRYWQPPSAALKQGGVVTPSGELLYRDATKAVDHLVGTASTLRNPGSPHDILRDLAGRIYDLRAEMAAAELGGPLGFGAFPGAADGSLSPTGQMIRDFVLQEYDVRAEEYLQRLRTLVSDAGTALDGTMTDTWPADVVKYDPDAPRPTG